MTLQFSGLGSGLPVNDWITALVNLKKDPITKMETKVTEIQNKSNKLNELKTAYSTLRSAAEKLTDARLLTSSNLFAVNKATSSNADALSLSMDSNSPTQSLSVIISRLATKTTVTSPSGAASAIDSNTSYAGLNGANAKPGTVIFSLDGESMKIDIEAEDTLGTISQKFMDAAADKGKTLDASVQNGKFLLKTESSFAITSSGTSDFVSVLGLKKGAITGPPDVNTYESLSQISVVNINKPIVSAESGIAGITEGTFTIGGDTFTITSSTTMNGLLNQINQSKTAGVDASFNESTGKLTLASKNTGELYVNIKAPSATEGGSSFTDVMGLTQNGTFRADVQDLGKNALFSVNGQDKEYINNTIPPSVSGITGLTMTLKKVPDNNETVTVNVERDNSKLTEAVKAFISAYNNAISKTDTLTSVTKTEANGKTTFTQAALSFNMGLTSIRNNIRNIASGIFSNDSEFKSLSDLGIKTASAGASVSDLSINLSLDEEKFNQLLLNNPDGVKDFLVGSLNNGSTGLLGSMYKTLNEALEPVSGFFVTQTNSYSSEMKNMNTLIDRNYERLKSYETGLQKQFTTMDANIAKMNQQMTQLQSALGLTTSSS